MFTLTLMLHAQVAPVVLRFSKSEHWNKARTRAAECLKGEQAGPIVFTDDFDGGLNCLGSNLLYANWEDLERRHVFEGEVQMIAALANADLQTRARGDVKLQAAARMMQIQNGGGMIRQ